MVSCIFNSDRESTLDADEVDTLDEWLCGLCQYTWDWHPSRPEQLLLSDLRAECTDEVSRIFSKYEQSLNFVRRSPRLHNKS